MNPDCSQCPAEPVARELAIKFDLSEYLVIFEYHHWRKSLDGSLIARAVWEIDYWHAFIRAAHRERKLIESRY